MTYNVLVVEVLGLVSRIVLDTITRTRGSQGERLRAGDRKCLQASQWNQ
jgi:hypothetical protein